MALSTERSIKILFRMFCTIFLTSGQLSRRTLCESAGWCPRGPAMAFPQGQTLLAITGISRFNTHGSHYPNMSASPSGALHSGPNCVWCSTVFPHKQPETRRPPGPDRNCSVLFQGCFSQGAGVVLAPLLIPVLSI